MKTALCMILSCAVVFVCSCTLVTSKTQVGEKPLTLKGKKWNGIWYDGDHFICFIKVKDKKAGILRAAIMNSESGDAKIDFSLKNFNIQIKKFDDLLFGNILCEDLLEKKDLDKSNAKTYIWFMMRQSRDKLLLYMPNSDFLTNLIKQKKLEGEKTKNCLIITESNKDFRKLIDSYGDGGKMFNWKEPITLFRLTKK